MSRPEHGPRLLWRTQSHRSTMSKDMKRTALGLLIAGVGFFLMMPSTNTEYTLPVSSKTVVSMSKSPFAVRFGGKVLYPSRLNPKVAMPKCGRTRHYLLPSISYPPVNKLQKAFPINSVASDEQTETIKSVENRDQVLKNGVQISTGPDTECTMQINVTIPFAYVKATVDKLVTKMSKNVTVPGFRKTKKKNQIPQDLVIGAIGTQLVDSKATERLIEETIWDALDDVKEEALPKSEKIRLFDQRKSVLQHIKKKDDFKYSITVEIIPEVRWRVPYDKLTIEIPAQNPEKEFEKKVLKVRQRFGEETPVNDRGYKQGDIAIISYDFERTEEDGGGKIFAALGSEIPMTMFRRVDGTEVRAVRYNPLEHELLAGVEQALFGMHEDETRTVRVRIPEDWDIASVVGVEALLRLRMEAIREPIPKELDDSLAPWLAQGATNLHSAMKLGVEEVRREQKQEDEAKLYDAITAAVAGNVINKLPERLLFQTAVQLYLEALPQSRKTTHDIESAPTLVERYIENNRKKVETTARARMGLRAIADAEGIIAPDEEVKKEAEKTIHLRGPRRKDGKDQGEPAEKIEDSKEWRNAKYALEMDNAVNWLKEKVNVIRTDNNLS
mmetsp:Transcript_9128/g.22398  ORF Transcript_9128/g.22398 Transcript_9128/m.22398 type:complete len:613 (-) Transcript_9128:57-1895(-)